jgi:N-acetylglucosaminyl-diphospho-decaprenol L-rhamnosyltransferase
VAGVERVGPVDDPRDELAACSVLLHCAEREPFGLALVEALASGRPVVAPDAGGPREIVDASCGVLYPAGDAAAAARGVVSLLEDPGRAASLGAAGRARAAALFDARRSRAAFARAVGLPPSSLRPDASALSIVTVTHNSAGALQELLRSVALHLPAAETIVVDNGSSDDSVAVARRFGASVLALEANVGFGAGCNRGLESVSTTAVALLNPDVELLDDSLAALAEQALAGPERLLAPLVLSRDGRRQDTVHAAPCSRAEVARAFLPAAALGGRAAAALAPWRSTEARPVGWAVGCALVARTETLRRLGGFDESIFLYGEDLELGLRAAARGVPTWFSPAARVLHDGGHSTSAAFGGEPVALLARARFDAVSRARGPGAARRDAAVQALTFAGRALAKSALGRGGGRELAQLRALQGISRR